LSWADSGLLAGKFDGKKFRFASKVQHGFDALGRQRAFDAVKRLHTRICPFSNLPYYKDDPFDENVTAKEMEMFVWVSPAIEVAVKYSEWTKLGSLRHLEFTNVHQV